MKNIFLGAVFTVLIMFQIVTSFIFYIFISFVPFVVLNSLYALVTCSKPEYQKRWETYVNYTLKPYLKMQDAIISKL